MISPVPKCTSPSLYSGHSHHLCDKIFQNFTLLSNLDSGKDYAIDKYGCKTAQIVHPENDTTLMLSYHCVHIGDVKSKPKNPMGPDGRYVHIRMHSVHIRNTTRLSMNGCMVWMLKQSIYKHPIFVISRYS